MPLNCHLYSLASLYCWKNKGMRHTNMHFLLYMLWVIPNNQNRVGKMLQKQRICICACVCVVQEQKIFLQDHQSCSQANGYRYSHIFILCGRMVHCFPWYIWKEKGGQLGVDVLGWEISLANKSNQKDLALIKTTEPCNCPFQKS